MPGLIDRQAALAEIDDTIAGSLQRPEDVYIDKGLMMARTLIEKLPTIEAEPVRRGHWEPNEDGEYHCTHCGVECDTDEFHKPLLNYFCGNCGAEMW